MLSWLNNTLSLPATEHNHATSRENLYLDTSRLFSTSQEVHFGSIWRRARTWVFRYVLHSQNDRVEFLELILVMMIHRKVTRSFCFLIKLWIILHNRLIGVAKAWKYKQQNCTICLALLFISFRLATQQKFKLLVAY